MLDQFIESIPEPVIILTADLVIDALNIPAQQFWARSTDTLTGRSLSDILGPDKELSAVCTRALGSNNGFRAFDFEVDRQFLGPIKCDVSASIFDTEGRLFLLLMPKPSASYLQSAPPDLKANEGLYHLVSMLAHEIKNPLAGIKGAAQLLEIINSEDGHELTQLIVEESDRLSALVDQFDFFSSSIETTKSQINIHEILVRVETIATNSFGKHVTFQRRYDPSLPEVWGDRDRLVQVFLNIVKNACEALSEAENSKVTLSTWYDHARVMLLDSGQTIQAPLSISIRDNGTGIPLELQAQIFEPFRTAKIGGKGLGLSVVTKILADHDAAVEFTSQPGQTEFIIRFPMYTADADPDQ